MGLFLQLLYLGEVGGLRQLRQAAAVRQLLRLFQVALDLEVINSSSSSHRRKDKEEAEATGVELIMMSLEQQQSNICNDDGGGEDLIQVAAETVVVAYEEKVIDNKNEDNDDDDGDDDDGDVVIDSKSLPVACSHCGQTFVTRRGLDRHVRMSHVKSGGAMRSAIRRTAVHTTSTAGLPQRRHACRHNDCPKRFVSERDLRDHENCHDGAGQSYLCPDCGDTFRSSKQMANHREKHKVLNADKIRNHHIAGPSKIRCFLDGGRGNGQKGQQVKLKQCFGSGLFFGSGSNFFS